MVEAAGLPQSVRDEAARSKALVDEASGKLNDPSTHNEYEWLVEA